MLHVVTKALIQKAIVNSREAKMVYTFHFILFILYF